MLKEMDYIYAVYEEKSFSRAAKKLFVSQPALSNMVKKAEKEIGAPIFDRSTIPLTVTPAGEYYIQSIQAIRNIQSNVHDYFEDLKNLNTGNINLGGSSYFCSFVFPEMIGRFHRHYPNVTIHLKEEMVDRLRAELLEDKLDLVLETAISREDKKITNLFYRDEHIILVVPKIFPVNLQLQPYVIPFEQIRNGKYLNDSVKGVPLIHFKDTPFIRMNPGNDMYERSTQICKNAGFKMKSSFYVDQVMTSFNIAASGAGAVFMRADIIRHLPEDNRLLCYKISDSLSVRTINWSLKKGRYVSKAVQEFIRIGNSVT